MKIQRRYVTRYTGPDAKDVVAVVPSDSLWRSRVAKTQRRPINTSERIDAEKKAAATRAESRGRPGRAVAARKHAGAERNFVQVGGSCSPRKSRERRVTERTGLYSVCPRPSVKQTSPTLVCAPSHFLSTFPRSSFIRVFPAVSRGPRGWHM